MRQIGMILFCVSIACLLGSSIFFLRAPEGETNKGDYININDSKIIVKGGNITLDCTLPTEQPDMSSVSVIDENINTCPEAKSFAINYFPQFSSVEFEQISDGEFVGFYREEYLQVFSSGAFIYYNETHDSIVDEGEFPLSSARYLTEEFINNHGGIGSYLEYEYDTIALLDEEGEETGQIMGYYYEYHNKYMDYTIFGADAIKGYIIAEGGIVIYNYRCNFNLGNPINTNQVISAEDAWNSVTYDGIKGDSDISITNIDLCYYEREHQNSTSVIFPAWRFSGPTLEFYINAFSGEPM